MYQIKKLLSRHIEENLIKYITVLILFAVGIILGFFFSQNISVDLSKNLDAELSVLVEGFTDGEFDKLQIVQTSFLKNLRNFAIIFLGGLTVWLIPLPGILFLSYGFSVGFTMGYLSVGFGGQGMGITVISLMPTFFINIPIYCMLSVIALNNSITKRSCRAGDGGCGSYVFVFLFMFLLSLVSVAADAFLIPNLITLICS